MIVISNLKSVLVRMPIESFQTACFTANYESSHECSRASYKQYLFELEISLTTCFQVAWNRCSSSLLAFNWFIISFLSGSWMNDILSFSHCDYWNGSKRIIIVRKLRKRHTIKHLGVSMYQNIYFVSPFD